jgi:hypothetical protein
MLGEIKFFIYETWLLIIAMRVLLGLTGISLDDFI